MITTEQMIEVEKAKGEYVKRTPDAKKVYVVEGYDRVARKYALTDADDMNRQLYVKKGTLVWAGFTY